MKRGFTPETVDAVLSGHELSIGPIPFDQLKSRTRTPLTITFPLSGVTGEFAPAEPTNRIMEPQIFNAVGSQVLGESGRSHLPVLDLDGGGHVQRVANGSKAILRAAPKHSSVLEDYTGKYGPQSMLRDILGDNGIDLEVFETPLMRHNAFMETTSYRGSYVTALALRSSQKNVFDVVDSTQKGHNHLFIQQEFSLTDHNTLIRELGTIGIISQTWLDLTIQQGMGIVRTPWTDKQNIHKST